MMRQRSYWGSNNPLLRASESCDHPAFVRIEEVSIRRPDMNLWSGKRSAAQDFLADEPFVVVFVKVRFESRIRNVIGNRPLPNIADHLMQALCGLAIGKCANRRDTPQSVFKEISFWFVRRLFAPREFACFLEWTSRVR